MRRTLAGPGENKGGKMGTDPGKTMGVSATSDAGGYRRVGTAASGPASSTSKTEYAPKLDPGRMAAAGSATDGYRRTAVAAGPGSSVDDYQPTLDPGKALSAPPPDAGYKRVGIEPTPQSGLDPGKAAPAGGSGVGYRTRSASTSGPGTDNYDPVSRDPGVSMSVSGDAGRSENSASPKFCSQCGTAAGGGKFCQECGSSL
eukprot:TRINITY_DN27451_c0_g1_i1.p1 TRINITY_DN27451_c0_g1~~TRINITY_DN27451_c0_g1_i1.p1  ORF type:complete len:201 (+),score=24.47 TRINITY_DN27451_c0_g1_i1:102-704(+)